MAVRARARPIRAANPEAGVLYRVLQQHLATFLNDASQTQDGAGLPKFVEKELQAFLKCGVLAHGFSRFRCTDCKFERLVPLSCKGRGFCPSCGGKRMTDVAAHLTDHVVPFVPVRQFVLSFPYWLRYRLAYDHDRCTAVLKIFMRAVLGFYRRHAREHGVLGGRGGSVTFVQRFGSAANLNLHAHAIVLDGVFAETPNGELALSSRRAAERRRHRRAARDDSQTHRAPSRTARLPARRSGRPVQRRIAAARELLRDLDRAPSDARQTARSAPAPPRRSRAARAEHRAPMQAHLDRFDLHAGLTIAAQHAHGRIALEKLLRYCARPPIAQRAS